MQNQKYDELIKEREYLIKFSTLKEYQEYIEKVSETILEDEKSNLKRCLIGAGIFLGLCFVVCVGFSVFSESANVLSIMLALFTYGGFMSFLPKIWELLPKTSSHSRFAKYEAMDSKNVIIGRNVIERLEEIEEELKSLE